MSASFTIAADTDPLPAPCDASCVHGDTWALTFTLQDVGPTVDPTTSIEGAAVPHDLTGATAAAGALDSLGARTVLGAMIGADPTLGVVTVTPPAPDGLAAGLYRYDMQVTGADASIITWAQGDLLIAQDVTP